VPRRVENKTVIMSYLEP